MPNAPWTHDPSQSVTSNVRFLSVLLDYHKPKIIEALAYTGGTHMFDDVCLMVMNNRAFLWTNKASFMVTEINEFPRQKHYHIWLAGGNLDDLMALQPQVQQVARDLGCNKLTINGRAGWAVVLKDHGISRNYTSFEKELTLG